MQGLCVCSELCWRSVVFEAAVFLNSCGALTRLSNPLWLNDAFSADVNILYYLIFYKIVSCFVGKVLISNISSDYSCQRNEVELKKYNISL